MITIARELFTVFCFLAFLYVVYFAFSRRNKATHESVGRSVIDDDDSKIIEP